MSMGTEYPGITGELAVSLQVQSHLLRVICTTPAAVSTAAFAVVLPLVVCAANVHSPHAGLLGYCKGGHRPPHLVSIVPAAMPAAVAMADSAICALPGVSTASDCSSLTVGLALKRVASYAPVITPDASLPAAAAYKNIRTHVKSACRHVQPGLGGAFEASPAQTHIT